MLEVLLGAVGRMVLSFVQPLEGSLGSPTVRRLLALLASIAPVAAFAQTWQSLGPSQTDAFDGATGRVPAIASSATDPNLYFAAGADGGVWRSRTAGASWTPVTDQLPTTAMGALLIDPANPNIIFAGSGEGNFANHSRPGLGIFRSTDQGDTWTQLGEAEFSGRCIAKLAKSGSSRLFAAVTRAGGFPTRAAAKGHPLAQGPRGLWSSLNNGDSWTRITNIPDLDVVDVVVDPSNSTYVYAAVSDLFGSSQNGVWRSQDGGDTWTRLSSSLPAASITGRIGLAIAPSNPARIYALIANPADSSGGSAATLGLFRSDDRGATWTVGAAPSVHSSYGWYFSTVAVSPTNADVVYIGALSLLRSNNAGTSFSDMGVPHPDVHALVFDAAGRLLVGCDGGVYRYASSWSALNQGLTLTQCYAGLSTHPTNPEVFLVGLQDNGGVMRTGNTTIWNMVTGGDGGWTQVNPLNPLIMYTQSQGAGVLYRSSDGVTFSGLSTGVSGRAAFYCPYTLNPTDPRRMFMATERIWLSTNSGSSFTTLSADLTAGGSAAIRTLAVAPSDPNYLYVATNDGRVLASSNAGAAFTLVRTGNPGWPRITRELYVDPRDPRSVYLAGATYSGTRLQMSSDAGATWRRLDAGLPQLPVNTVAADTSLVPPRLFAGTEAGVYLSDDQGATWARYGTGMPNVPVIDLVFEPSRGRLLAATQGRGVWRMSYVSCPGDFNRDGGVDGNDVEAFFLAWEASDPRADLNQDGGVDGNDVEAFFVRWETGC